MLLAEVSRLVSHRYDLPETFDGLLRHLRRALEVDILALALPKNTGSAMQLRYSCSSGVVDAELPSELSLEESPSAAAWATQETVLIDMDDGLIERRWPKLVAELRKAGLRTYCSLPLTAGDRRIGALGVGSRKCHAFGEDDVELLQQVCIPAAMAVENELIREHADRYRNDLLQARDHAAQLLRLSSAVAEQPTVEAVLHSLRGVLANINGVHSAALYLLSDDRKALRLYAMDHASDGPDLPKGMEIACTGAFSQVVMNQEAVCAPDCAKEMLRSPQLAPFAGRVGQRSAYLFPVTTSRKQYGVLTFTSAEGKQFGAEDAELLSSLASHLAVALEGALSVDAAAGYQQQLAEERDRLALLLEINNHIVSRLEADDLFPAVAASMRKHFANDLTSLWLVNKQTGLAERKFLDFPTGKGFLAKANVAVPAVLESDWFRRRMPRICSAELAELPPALREACRAESIVSAVLIPLAGASGALGLLVMTSRKAHAFREADLDLLSQIGTQISLVLDNALAYGRLRASHEDSEVQRLYLESEIRAEHNFEEMIGDSPAWRRVVHQITTVAPTDAGVLLLGETGTGKELIARAIHSRSRRRDRTLVKLSCAAVPMGLLESELFGHEKGAFTGALTKQVGRFELANRGSLFLDEVGDIPLELQTKLLRALQEQEFERLGNPHTIKVDVRVIAATHCDLTQMVKDRAFRQDLYYRLNVFPILVPPLRERGADIELLVRHFVAKYAGRMHKRIESIPAGTMKVFRKYPWPGNIRELEHFIERAVILSATDVLQAPVEELSAEAAAANVPTLEEGEREQILQALQACQWVIGGPKGAAARLAINRSTLNSRMRKLGISRGET
ncbi:MAG: sigma 54-interacting transcriptional regulator [Acidobacteria bacterium]|nr:sigma 54-interacting transcriptional regulator [Acidobacteriota bacterium]